MNQPLILIVEDERLIARDIATQLHELGYRTVGPATTGEKAIEMAQSLRPQLVLMDVHLASTMDGITAAQTIRDQFDIPSLFLSAFDAGHSLERAERTQPVGFLVKPFLDSELQDAVAAAFKQR